MIIHKIQMDLINRGMPRRIDAVQFDENSRAVKLSLYSGGIAWEPPDGAEIAVSYRKPDKTSGLYDTLPDGTVACSVSGNEVTAILAPQMLTVPGVVVAAIVLYSGAAQLSTFQFVVNVEPNPSAGGGVSNDYYNYQTFGALNSAIGSLNDLETSDKSSLVGAINELFITKGTVKSVGGILPDVTGNIPVDWMAQKTPRPLVILEETSISPGFSGVLTYEMLEGQDELAVTYDDRLFVCVPHFSYSEGDGYYVWFGNQSLFSSSLTDTGEPFYIHGYKNGTSLLAVFEDSEAHTMSVTGSVYDYVKMPEEYLPDGVVRTVNGVEPDEDGNVEITVSDSVQNDYVLPVATAETLGGVKPVAKTDDMTQAVGVDADGRLYTAPSTSTGTGTGSGEIADGSITPEKTTFFNSVMMDGGDKEVWTANSMHVGTMLDKNGNESATPTLTGMGVSDYLPVSYGNTVTITGMWQSGYNSGKMFYYDSNKTLLGSFTPGSASVTTFTVDNADAAYFRFNARSEVSSVIVSSEAAYEYVIKDKHIPSTTNIDDLNESSLKTYSSAKIYSLDFNRAKWRGKKVIVDGDSITHAGSWHSFLSDWFGWGAVYNHACSGNTLTTTRAANDASGVGNGLKGYERVQQNYETDADVIILMGDGNDWTPVGTYTDTTEDTWCGAMNLMIDAIIEKYPLKPLILISNPPRGGDTGRNGLGGQFDNQAKAMRDLAQNKHLYYIDCYHTNMFRPGNTVSTESFTNNADGVHLNETASELMAQMIFEELKKVGFNLG